MSKKGHIRQIPPLAELPRPVYARPESWGPQGSQTDWHDHAWGQFSYAVQGVLQVETPFGHYLAPPQFAIWVPQGMTHKVSSLGSAEMRSLYVRQEAIGDNGWLKARVCQVTPLCRELIVRYCSLSERQLQDLSSERLVAVLLDELDASVEANTVLPMPQDKRLLSLCVFLLDNPQSRETIHLLSQRIGLSGRSVSRLFSLQTGLTFQQWRQRSRLLAALSALEKGESVTRVALDCGYDSLSAFVAVFKKHFSVTPGQFFSLK